LRAWIGILALSIGILGAILIAGEYDGGSGTSMDGPDNCGIVFSRDYPDRGSYKTADILVRESQVATPVQTVEAASLTPVVYEGIHTQTPVIASSYGPYYDEVVWITHYLGERGLDSTGTYLPTWMCDTCSLTRWGAEVAPYVAACDPARKLWQFELFGDTFTCWDTGSMIWGAHVDIWCYNYDHFGLPGTPEYELPCPPVTNAAYERVIWKIPTEGQ